MAPLTGSAIAGFDCRVDEDGISHAWRMIVWCPTSTGDVVVRHVGPLPEGHLWLSVPRDHIYGDLQMLEGSTLDERGAVIARELLSVGIEEIVVGDDTCAVELMTALRLNGVAVRELEGYMEKTQKTPDSEQTTPRREFPGQAGTEIANIKTMTGAKA